MLTQESKNCKKKTIVVTANIKMQKVALKYMHAGLGDIENIDCMPLSPF